MIDVRDPALIARLAAMPRHPLHSVCAVCGRLVNATVVGDLDPRARLVAKHLADGRHEPTVYVGMERVR